MSDVLSVRLSEEDRKKLEELSDELSVGVSVLARMLIHSSLTNLEELRHLRATGRFPLALLSDLLEPAARSRGLTEEQLTETIESVREEIWKDRYGPVDEE